MLSQLRITELQTILKEDYNSDSTYEDVAAIAESLVAYVETLQEINTNEHNHAQKLIARSSRWLER